MPTPSADIGGGAEDLGTTPRDTAPQPVPLCASVSPHAGGVLCEPPAPWWVFFLGGGARLTCGWRCGCCCGPCPGTSPGGGRSGRRRCCGCSWGTRTPCSSTGCRPARRCPRRAGPRSLREGHASVPPHRWPRDTPTPTPLRGRRRPCPPSSGVLILGGSRGPPVPSQTLRVASGV